MARSATKSIYRRNEDSAKVQVTILPARGVLDCILHKPHLKDPTQALQFAQGKKGSAEAERPSHQCQGYGGSQENCKLQSSVKTIVMVLEKVETKVLKSPDITRNYTMSTKMHFMAPVSGLGLCFTRPSDLISDF